MKALITGITGQDGSYLAEYLLDRGYEVHGLLRRSSTFNRLRIDHLRTYSKDGDKRLFLHYADLQDTTTLRRLVMSVRPNEIYHLAGQSHVGLSFEIPESTFKEIASATLSLLEICRDFAEPVKLYHASSSEIFGAPTVCPQNESTPMLPQSPYACAKVFATNICSVYRSAYGVLASSGITYNHESPRRGENFVTRKITLAAAAARHSETSILKLGNLNAARDWGYAKEYVEAMWLLLQQASPQDIIIASGRLTTVREFAAAAYSAVGFDLIFEGEGDREFGRDSKTGRRLVEVDPAFFRPVEPSQLCGDPTHASNLLGWTAKTTAKELAELMTREDLAKFSVDL